MKSKPPKMIRKPSAKSEDQPATRKMLSLVRTELMARMDSGFAQMDSRFAQIDSKFAQIDSRLENFDARFTRMEFLLEEQNANNRIVLEGLQALWQRQDSLERRFDSR